MKQIYQKRLETFEFLLRNLETELPEVKVFCMSTWGSDWTPEREAQETEEETVFSHLDPDAPNVCGTAACALGSAALYPPFIKQGLHVSKTYPDWANKKDNIDQVIGCTDPETGYKYENGAAGQLFFGLSRAKSDLIFMDFSASRFDIADRIAKLLKGEEPEKTKELTL